MNHGFLRTPGLHVGLQAGLLKPLTQWPMWSKLNFARDQLYLFLSHLSYADRYSMRRWYFGYCSCGNSGLRWKLYLRYQEISGQWCLLPWHNLLPPRHQNWPLQHITISASLYGMEYLTVSAAFLLWARALSLWEARSLRNIFTALPAACKCFPTNQSAS